MKKPFYHTLWTETMESTSCLTYTFIHSLLLLQQQQLIRHTQRCWFVSIIFLKIIFHCYQTWDADHVFYHKHSCIVQLVFQKTNFICWELLLYNNCVVSSTSYTATAVNELVHHSSQDPNLCCRVVCVYTRYLVAVLLNSFMQNFLGRLFVSFSLLWAVHPFRSISTHQFLHFVIILF